MSILEVNNVSIRYMTGDFKDIGIKEYVTRRLRGKYEVKKFWADKHVPSPWRRGTCWASSVPTVRANPPS